MDVRYVLRSFTAVTVVVLAGCALSGDAFSQDTGSGRQLSGPLWVEGTKTPAPPSTPPDQRIWAHLTKTLRPAVVSITTTQEVGQERRSPFRGPGGEQDPFQEFMRRFFGESPGGQPRLPAQSLGSGFIIHPDGYIVTTNNTVEKATEIRVRLHDGKEFGASVVGRDAKTDLALIKIDAKNLPAAPFGDSEQLEVGEPVIAIGNPFGLAGTVSTGIVSGKGRVLGEGPYDDFIQLDMLLYRGSSGSPLFNLRGEIIGIVSALFSPSGESLGIGFATPINQAKGILPQLQAKGSVTRAWLGVSIQPVTPDVAKTLGLPEAKGALIVEVLADSPAQKAGMKQGDVIVEFDGKAVKSSSGLPRIVAATPVGKTVTVKVLRDGKETPLQVTLAELEDQRLASARPGSAAPRPALGMTLQDLTPDLARALGLKDTRGVVVNQIEPGSPADAAGLQVGDVILEVSRTKVQTVQETQQALEKIEPGKGILLVVRRGESQIFVAIKPG